MDGSYRERRAEAERRSRRLRVAVSCGIGAVLVCALVALGLWAMGGDEAHTGMAEDGAAGVTSQGWQPREPQTEETVEVQDTLGRVVAVPADPVSIAVFDSFCGEFAVMVGAGERLCGVPGGVKSDTLLQEICPRLAKGADEGGVLQLSGNSINIEAVLERGCDLAIVKETMAEAECAKLESQGIPYVMVGYRDMADQREAMAVVGRACGEEASAKAQEFVSYYEQVLKLVEEHAARIAPEEVVSVYHSINTALLTDAQRSLGADWVEAVGCVDVSLFASPVAGTDYQATPEQLYEWDPDVVICNAATASEEFKSDEKWSGLRAVREGQVHTIPTGATRWGQRGSVETYLAMLWLGCTVYPEVYGDVDLKRTVCDYYWDYLGVEVDDALWERMVAGEGLRSAGTGEGGQG